MHPVHIACLVARLLVLPGILSAADFRYTEAGLSARVGLEVEQRMDWAERSAGGAPTFTRHGIAVEWHHAPGQVSATLHNPTAAPITLGRFVLAQADAVPGNVALVMSGWQLPNLVQPTHGKKLVSKTMIQLWEGDTSTALQVGFVTFDRINTEIELENGVITAFCDFEGFVLAPGASIRTERLLLSRGNDPVAGLHAWADAAAAHYQPRIWPGTPAGWVGWSWVDPFHIETYEEVVRRNARAIRQKLPGSGIDYVWISLGNLKDREPGNWLDWNRKLLPSGPQALVRDLAAQDFKLGLWAGVFWMSSRLEARSASLRDAFLLRDGKPMTVPSPGTRRPIHPRSHASQVEGVVRGGVSHLAGLGHSLLHARLPLLGLRLHPGQVPGGSLP
jgi:hypothetical protein